MTLIELFWFVVFAFVGGHAAIWAYHRFGWLGGVAGFLVGFFGAWAVLYGVFWVLGYLQQIIYSGRPPNPPCRNGKCRSVDYKFESPGKGQSGYRCRCGLLYRKRGQRFMEALPDGSLRPYMIWKAFRGWFPEVA